MQKTKTKKALTVIIVFEIFWAINLLGFWGYGAIKKAQPAKPFEATYTISNR